MPSTDRTDAGSVVSPEAEKLWDAWQATSKPATTVTPWLAPSKAAFLSMISSALEAARREERERCAEIAEQYARERRAEAKEIGSDKWGSPIIVAAAVAESLAAAIRSRPTPKAPEGAPE